MSDSGLAGAAIELDGAGKRYDRLAEQPLLLRSLLPFSRPTRTDTWALRDVSACIEPGETVGVLGRNGAGKTTMLRLLAGVTRPSEGSVTVHGRVSPLISVGVGFHPEMTGRENVQVNGMLLGLSRDEVAARFDAIVAFAELAEVIDTPVKFYSSGMFMRLGFSVAVHVDPQVLLVDEVLAVGDIAFQLKCFDRMRALQAGGTTIVLVSHSMHAIRLLCPRVLLLRDGHLELDGDSESAIARHHDLLGRDSGSGESQGAHLGQVELVERSIEARSGTVTSAEAHDALRYKARLRFLADVESPHLFFNVLAEDGTPVYEMKSAIGKAGRSYRAGEEAKVEVRFRAHLGGGTYRLQLTITDRTGRVALLRDPVGALLYLPPPLGSAGLTDLDAQIRLDGKRVSDHDALLLHAGDPPDGRRALMALRKLRVGVPPSQWRLPAGTSVGRIWGAGLPRLARTCRVVEADPGGRGRRVDVWLTDGHQGPIDVAEPVVAHLHEAIWDDPDGASLLDPTFVAHYGPLSEAAARSATLVMTGSGAARDQLVRVYGLDAARVRVAYDGVDVELHRPGLQGGGDIVGRAGGDPDRPYVLFVGTLHPRKNLPVLREAMASLAAGGSPHALVLVAGPAPDRVDSSDLAAAATAPLAGRPVVNLAGIGDEDLAALMGGAAALCLPSLLEGFGLPVVEAMASGTPVVVADRGSLPEVVGDAGVVVSPDAASVAAGLRSVLDDPARAAELAIAGRARAERFSWDAMVESWSEVLHEAAGRVSAGRAPADR